jgi:hypothetical protein
MYVALIDLIIASSVIQNLSTEDFNEVLRSFYFLLKPGGAVLLGDIITLVLLPCITSRRFCALPGAADSCFRPSVRSCKHSHRLIESCSKDLPPTSPRECLTYLEVVAS